MKYRDPINERIRSAIIMAGIATSSTIIYNNAHGGRAQDSAARKVMLSGPQKRDSDVMRLLADHIKAEFGDKLLSASVQHPNSRFDFDAYAIYLRFNRVYNSNTKTYEVAV